MDLTSICFSYRVVAVMVTFWNVVRQKSTGADHRSRGSKLKVTSIQPEERPGAAQQQCIDPKDLRLCRALEGDWRWEDCGKVISSVKWGYCEDTACPTAAGMLFLWALVTSSAQRA